VTGWRRLWRWSWRLVLVLLLCVLALPAALFGLTATEGGSAWLLDRGMALAQRAGVELRIGRSQGRLLDRLELFDVHFAGLDARVEAARLLLDWRPRALVDGELHLRAVEADALSVVPPPGEDGADADLPLQIPDLALPVAVRLDRLAVRELAVGQGDAALRLTRVGLAAVAESDRLDVHDLVLRMDGAGVDGALGVGTTAPHALEARLAVSLDEALTGPEVGTVEAVATLAGTLLQPDLDLRLTAPQPLHLSGRVDLARGARPATGDAGAGRPR